MVRRSALALLAVSFQASALCAYVPPACSGLPVFIDVPNSHALCPWMVELLHEGITQGCDPEEGAFCPDDPVTRAQASLMIGKALHEHLWGEGRPGATVYDDGNALCASPVTGIYFGLSNALATWGQAAAGCPAGYWVCTLTERGVAACDTTRPFSVCGWRDCTGVCNASTTSNELAWVADNFADQGLTSTESGIPLYLPLCQYRPVWCCTGA